MGSFDTVNIKCPWCGETHGEQIKSGPCDFITRDLESAPSVLKVGVSNYPIECDNCGEKFQVKVQSIARVYKCKADDDLMD
jgi:transcription elongation factor Elf1